MQQPTEYSNEVDLGYCFLTLFYVFPPKNRFRKKRISVKYLQNFRLLSLSFTRKESFRRKIFHFGAFSNRKLSYFLTNNERVVSSSHSWNDVLSQCFNRTRSSSRRRRRRRKRNNWNEKRIVIRSVRALT